MRKNLLKKTKLVWYIVILLLCSCVRQGIYVSDEMLKITPKHIELRTPEEQINLTIDDVTFVGRWFLIKFLRDCVVTDDSVVYVVEYIRDSNGNIYINPIEKRSVKLLKGLEEIRLAHE